MPRTHLDPAVQRTDNHNRRRFTDNPACAPSEECVQVYIPWMGLTDTSSLSPASLPIPVYASVLVFTQVREERRAQRSAARNNRGSFALCSSSSAFTIERGARTKQNGRKSGGAENRLLLQLLSLDSTILNDRRGYPSHVRFARSFDSPLNVD